jgi:hypothetical protein
MRGTTGHPVHRHPDLSYRIHQVGEVVGFRTLVRQRDSVLCKSNLVCESLECNVMFRRLTASGPQLRMIEVDDDFPLVLAVRRSVFALAEGTKLDSESSIGRRRWRLLAARVCAAEWIVLVAGRDIGFRASRFTRPSLTIAVLRLLRARGRRLGLVAGDEHVGGAIGSGLVTTRINGAWCSGVAALRRIAKRSEVGVDDSRDLIGLAL